MVSSAAINCKGMSKMVINHLEKLFITSDAATIVKESDVHHPAAKMIAQAAKTMEDECGDATNLVFTMTGELMAQAQGLIQMGLHPSEILIGYEKAGNRALNLLEKLTAYEVQNHRDVEELARCIKSTIASKQFGLEDFLSGLVAQAAVHTMPSDIHKFNVDNVRVQKILGGGIHDSVCVQGMVSVRSPETTVRRVLKAKVAVFNTNIEMQQGETKGTVLLKSADDLLNYSKGEEDEFEKFIKGLAEAGVGVVVGSGSMSELAVHYFEKYQIMAIKIMSKWEVKRIARAVGANPTVKLETPTPEDMGYADEVAYTEISSKWCTVFRRDMDENKMCTIVLRGSTNAMLDDTERAIMNATNTVKSLIKDKRMLAGAGATEIHLAADIQAFAKTQPGLDQYAIEKYGEAFEVIPRTLAENAGLKAETILAKLYAAKSSRHGIDCNDGEVKDVVEVSILDSMEAKTWAIKLVNDVVLTILKVDQIIMAKPAGGPGMANQAARRPDGYDD